MAVCWSIALADRINLLKAESESANQRVAEQRTQALRNPGRFTYLGWYYMAKTKTLATLTSARSRSSATPIRESLPDISAGRTLAQAINYFSLKVAGSGEIYPIENFPVFSALRGNAAMADDVEADQGDKRVPLEIWASPIRDDAGEVESAVVAFQDVTLRKQAEMAQHISETRFRVIAENNFDGIAFMGRDRKVLYVSPSYQRLVGKTAEELIGQSGIGLVHPDDRDYTAKKFNQVLQQPNTRITAEYRIPHKDGSWMWVETFAINMLDNPYVQAVVLNSHDITERKQTEAELAEYREHLETQVRKELQSYRMSMSSYSSTLTGCQRSILSTRSWLARLTSAKSSRRSSRSSITFLPTDGYVYRGIGPGMETDENPGSIKPGES